jgi:hypothetical protein
MKEGNENSSEWRDEKCRREMRTERNNNKMRSDRKIAERNQT